MITVKKGFEKIRTLSSSQKALHLSEEAIEALEAVLEGATITQRESFIDPVGHEYMGFIEARLSQPNLGYLAPDQSNGLWGGSTTQALCQLAQVYNLGSKTGQVLDSDLLLALLDGQKSPTSIKSKPSSYDWLKELVEANGGKWGASEGKGHIVGIRGWIYPGQKVENIPNVYNDVLYFACIKNGQKIVKAFVSSCDPGYYYYKIRVLNQRGCAHLKAGHYKYQLGTHRNYQALIQAAPVTVVRSFEGNAKKGDPEDTGYFGLNIHAGTAGENVYNASAGCQVIQSAGPNGWQWVQFIGAVKSVLKAGEVINYSLIEKV